MDKWCYFISELRLNTSSPVKGKELTFHLFDSHSLVTQAENRTQLDEGLLLQGASALGMVRPEAQPQDSNHRESEAVTRGTHTHLLSLNPLLLKAFLLSLIEVNSSGQKQNSFSWVAIFKNSLFLSLSPGQSNCLCRTNCWIMKRVYLAGEGCPIYSTRSARGTASPYKLKQWPRQAVHSVQQLQLVIGFVQNYK